MRKSSASPADAKSAGHDVNESKEEATAGPTKS